MSLPPTAEPDACLPAGPSRPPRALCMPRGAWDTHAHVISGDARHPFVPLRTYTPPPVSADDYVAMLDTVGLDHGVLIQISVHGVDNGPIVEALQRYPQRLRGVVAIDGSESDETLARLREAGVCGVRINELFAGGSCADQLQRIADRCRPLGWHVDLALHGHRLHELAPTLRELNLRLVIDHMGWCPASRGVDDPDFQAVLELASMDDCWTKLSGAYRVSSQSAPFDDVAPFVRALVRAAPDRTVWGSDWPHVAIFDPARMPEPGMLLDALQRHLDDPVQLQAVLVDNPLRLFGQPGNMGGRAIHGEM